MIMPTSLFDVVEEADDYSIYSMTSELNHPLLTENSPNTRAAITLKGVLSIFGVLTEASLSPSIANSSMRNCHTSGTLTVSLTIMKAMNCPMR